MKLHKNKLFMHFNLTCLINTRRWLIHNGFLVYYLTKPTVGVHSKWVLQRCQVLHIFIIQQLLQNNSLLCILIVFLFRAIHSYWETEDFLKSLSRAPEEHHVQAGQRAGSNWHIRQTTQLASNTNRKITQENWGRQTGRQTSAHKRRETHQPNNATVSLEIMLNT